MFSFLSDVKLGPVLNAQNADTATNTGAVLAVSGGFAGVGTSFIYAVLGLNLSPSLTLGFL